MLAQVIMKRPKMENESNIIFNPYDTNLAGIITAAIQKYLAEFQTCIPAIVKKVPSRNTVIVTPAVAQTDINWKVVPWANIELPVHTPSGGGIIMSYPVAVGDTGWIIAGDLDPSRFMDTIGATPTTQPQNSFLRHQYHYGYFVPDKIKGYTISEDDAGAVVIQTADGKTKFSLKDGTITLLSADKISIEADTTLNINSNNVTINASDKVIINGTDWQTHKHTVPTGIAVQVNPTSGTGATTATMDTTGVIS